MHTYIRICIHTYIRRYVLEVEPYKEQQMVVREADEGQLDLADPTLVKPKLRRPFKLKGRQGPRRKLKTKSKVVKRASSGGKTNKSRFVAYLVLESVY
jgi:hypothetical protein